MDKKGKKNSGGVNVRKMKNDSGDDSAGSGDEIVETKPSKMSGFQLLDIEEPDDSASDSSEETSVQTKKPPAKNAKKKKADNDDEDVAEDGPGQPTKPQPAAGKKAAGKNKKTAKNKADEEDIDALLAELNIDTKQTGNKKKEKKGKKAKEEEEEVKSDKLGDAEVANKQITIELKPNMTQEEIAKAMEEMYGDDTDEDKKKKKKKAVKKSASKPLEGDEDDGEGVDEDGEGDEEGGTVKTAAQKKREKKERQRQEKLQKGKGKVEPAASDKASKAVEKPTASGDSAAASQEKAAESVTQPAAAVIESLAATDTTAVTSAELGQAAETAEKDSTEATEDSSVTDGKKKSKKEREKEKKKKGIEKEEKPAEKKPSKMVRQMQEQLRLIKEQEEKLKREEEEKIRKEEEALQQKLEKERLEKERKEREKLKKKQKIERQKAEGTYLTAKERENRRRAQQMLEAMKAQGMDVPQVGATEAVPEKPKKVVYDNRPKKKKQQEVSSDPTSAERQESNEAEAEVEADEGSVEEERESPHTDDTHSAAGEGVATAVPTEKEEDVKDAWDVSSEEEDEEEEKEEVKTETQTKTVESSVKKPDAGESKKTAAAAVATKKEESEESDDDDDEEDDDDDDDEDDDESEDDESEDDGKSNKEKVREKALARIQKRKEEAEAKKSLDKLRAPVVCVLGHVDTGKTKILDKLRHTNVQDGEAGGITQQIGATNVPQDTIKEQTKMCKEFVKKELKIPGLLIIDTPGHESFSNLRTRGSSLCDIAILVIDIMHGLEPQTIESINLLKSKKTPFVVALNKIDRLFQWQTNPQSDVVNTIKKQKQNTKLEFDERAQAAIVQLAEQGLNAALFYENKNVREYVNVVPTSAQTGDGMGNLIAVICELTQQMLCRQLMFSEELKATVMEVKALPGLGTTIDVILVNGELHEGETIIVAGQEGPIVTQIRALLMPQPLRELRVKSAYEHHKVVQAAQGCKIVAKDLERALAGLPLFVAKHPDEIDIHREEVAELLKEVLGSIKVAEKGVFVQASTLGSLEALLEFLKSQQIPFAGINIGPVHKRDIMKASVMLEREEHYATILAFDVKVERDAQEMADNLGVRIFTADIIYHLFDKFTAYREDYKKKKQEEFKHIAVFPCKLRILPQCIFKTRDPIVIGVSVEAGFLKEGTIICVPSKEFVDLGRISSIEVNHKPVERATKGQEVCIKIDPIPGEAPKMFGRHFEASDILVSKISRASIDAVKNYFREELSKADWVLMVELKKTFEIL